MRVLLIGEYSGVHTNLAAALRDKNIDVTTVHGGDAYKNYPADILIKYRHIESENYIFKKLLSIYFLFISYFGVVGCIQILKYRKELKSLKNYDVVQIINPIALAGFGSIVNYILLNFLKKNNKKIFLCALGDDYIWVKGAMNDKTHKSMFYNIKLKYGKEYIFPYMHRYGLFYKKLNYFAIKISNRILPGAQDYYEYYKKFRNCNEIVPIPINIEKNRPAIKFDKYPIKIFHGWQPNKEARKGNDLFDLAIKSLIKNYPNLITYEVVGGVSYEEYINKYEESIIFIDQCYSMDKGVNALLGMESGKIVIGKFTQKSRSKFDINNGEVMIDIEPTFESIYKNIENVIINPKVINDISKNAIKFIRKYHDSFYVAEIYLKIWKEF